MALRKFFQIMIFLVLLLGVLIRFYHLPTQGFLFHDEAIMFNRGGVLKTCMLYPDLPCDGGVVYVDSKILWIFLLGLAQALLNNAYCSGQIVSALFGIASIWITYVFSVKFYKSRLIASFSAFFLAVSFMHIVYSRVSLPETTSSFLAVCSLYLYLKGIPGHKKYVLLSGILAGLCFLLNRYRVLLLPIFGLILELYSYHNNNNDFEVRALKYPLFLCGVIAPPVVYEVFSAVAGHLGLTVPSYFSAVKTSLVYHNFIAPSVYSFFAYPFYIWKFEGAIASIFILTSVLWIKNKRSSFLPLIFVLLQLLSSSLVDEKSLRSVTVVLPFMAMLCGLSFFNFYVLLCKKRAKILCLFVLIPLICLGAISHAVGALDFKSGMEKAMAWFKREHGGARFLSINPIALVYFPEGKLFPLNYPYKYSLKSFSQIGIEFLLIDPQAYVLVGLDEDYFHDTKIPNLVREIESSCVPIAVFDDYNIPLQQWLILDHTRNFKLALGRLNKINEETGKIKIYNIGRCVKAAEK